MNALSLFRRYIRTHRKLHVLSLTVLTLTGTLPPSMAADILRGGGAAGGAGSGGQAPPVGLGNAPANVVSNRSNAQDLLVRTQQAQQAVWAMQAAARAAALNGPNNLGANPNAPGQTLPDVPNGLGAGGLEVAPGVAGTPGLWTGALQPTQTVTSDRTTVTVVQTAQQALLNWRTFNVGKETTLKFDQSAGGANKSQWIAFNKVNDPTGNPTQILGNIEAPGQVYIINQNGIIFGGSSQVNTHTLVASALPINDNLVARGLLNNPDAQFLFSALALDAGSKGPTPGFTPPPSVNGRSGDVTVQAGARIESPTTAANVGGRVALIGANVTNRGVIATPDGQTILAAGLQVGFVAHSSSDPGLRGLDTFIGAVVDPLSLVPEYAGTARNEGLIDAPRANVTMAGKTVEQNGQIKSSTSVALNGSVKLDASYGAITNTAYDPVLLPNIPPFLLKQTGAVKLGAGSVTQILPELSSTDTVIGTELALRSQVDLRGKVIHFGKGSVLHAPNGLVHADAGVWDYVAGANPQSYFVHAGGQIYVDTNAVLNVAGTTDVNVSVSKFLLTLDLRAAELADSPLQRNSALRGQSITVDVRNTGTYNGKTWVGTPLADVSGYVNNIQRTVGELTIAGGTIDLNAGGSVVVRQGAELNTSGGWINYTGASLETTKLIAGNQIYDIADATPDIAFTGILQPGSVRTDLKWAIVDRFKNPVRPGGAYFDPGYLHGGHGGKLSLTAPSVALDGTFIGRTTPGPNQRAVGPRPSEFILRLQAQQLLAPIYSTYSPTPPTVTFTTTPAVPSIGEFSLDANGNPSALPADRLANVYLAPELLTRDGFGRFTVENVDGDIRVAAGVTLRAAPRNFITLAGANINIEGSLIAPNGQINLTAFDISPSAAAAIQRDPFPVAPPPNVDRGLITLGSSARLSTAGLQLDDRVGASARLTSPTAIHGGAITLKAYRADLQAGSILDVSGGFVVDSLNLTTYGKGGAIHIMAGQDATLEYVTGGGLSLGASLLGYAGHHGGSLHVQAPLVQVGGAALHQNSLVLDASFFTRGGFSDYHLTGLGLPAAVPGSFIPGLYVAPGTIVEPVADNYVTVLNPKTGTLTTQTVRLPVGLRSHSSLTLEASGVEGIDGLEVRGDIVVGAGAVVRLDPRGNIALHGHTVTVLGALQAAGGHIEISGSRNSFPLLFPDQTQALATVYLGSGSTISTAGAVVFVPDTSPLRRRLGEVLEGGVVEVSGNIAAAQGAVIDVSGTTGILDLHPAQANPGISYGSGLRSNSATVPSSLATVATKVDSNGGLIRLSGGQLLATDATLLGAAGGATALGGTLEVSSGRFYPPNVIPPVLDTTLVVRQTGLSISPLLPDDATAVGRAITAAGGTPLVGRGYFSADSFAGGGFDSLTLGGAVEFSGAVTLNARGIVRLADSGVLAANGAVTINAGAVKLGADFAPPVRPEDRASQLPFANVAPSAGSGSLTINARHVEVGTISLQGISQAVLAANGGDILGNGIFNIAGRLTLRANQIFPTTASDFLVVAYDRPGQSGKITVEASGTSQLPLSAGGNLSLYATEIEQNGTLRAPFGSINLGWDGTGVAPSDLLAGAAIAMPVTTKVTLGNGSNTSVSGVDPSTGNGIVVPYGVSLDGVTWIDPRGVDITAGGLPEKIINVSAGEITMAGGATVDLRGGGDLYAYQWVKGNGGSLDILESSGAFAVIPGYSSSYASYGAFNGLNNSNNLIRAAGEGYVNQSLHVGDRIYLSGSESLAAGYYTLLPARYALLPGAVLVTPKSGPAAGSMQAADGSSVVSGYRYNALNTERTLPTISARFEIASGELIRQRAEYRDLSANSFLSSAAAGLNIAAPRLPRDSGYLLLQATQSMSLAGTVASVALAGPAGTVAGRGASIDINAPGNIIISGTPGAATVGAISLSAQTLTSWAAESLIIGGKRTTDNAGTTLTVSSSHITVNNAGSPLSAGDLTLATKGTLAIAAGSQIHASGTAAASGQTYAVNGSGSLLRVSQSSGATIARTGVTGSTGTALSVGAGASVSGASLTLDTTSLATSLDAQAVLGATEYYLSSGRINLQFSPGTLPVNSGLTLSTTQLAALGNAKSVSLRSYSSIDIHGAGNFGGTSLERLTLSAGEVRGFNQVGGSVTFTAKQITLDNAAGGSIASSAPTLGGGTLVFQSESMTLGSNSLRVNQFTNVQLNGLGGILVRGAGSFSTQGSLTVNASQIVGDLAAQHNLLADGAVLLQTPATEIGDRVSGSLGVSLTIQGSTVTSRTRILLPSGSLTMRATAGDLTVGNRINAGGVSQTFYDVTKYTNGGDVSLSSATGSINVNAGGIINVGASAGGGNAGSLIVSAPGGSFVNQGTLLGQGGTGGLNGRATFDLGALASYASLRNSLASASFTTSQNIRVRSGNVLIDGLTNARDFQLSADQGSITVTGSINASGTTGGSIFLASRGDLIIATGAQLTVRGQQFDSAGKGGAITLESGTQRNGVVGTGAVNIQTGSVLDLSVAALVEGGVNDLGSSASLGQFPGKLHIRSPLNAGGTDVLIAPINGAIVGASSLVVEGYRLYDLTTSGGSITSTVRNSIHTDAQAFLGAAGVASANQTNITNRLLANNASLSGLFVLAPGAEIINRSGGLTLGAANSDTTADWDLSSFRYGSKSTPGILTLRAAGNLIFHNALSDGFSPTLASSDASWLWLARLTNQNPLLPVNTQSWSYRLSAGADLSAASFRQVTTGAGSLLLGKDGGATIASGATNALTSSVIAASSVGGGRGLFQVIRTGSGDITISAGRNVEWLNQFSAIYTAGTRVADPTLGGAFDVPSLSQAGGTGALGAIQQNYPALYSSAGGNVIIDAKENLQRLGAAVTRELPNNWLYRRGYVNDAGEFGQTGFSTAIGSTSWWIDFSNFFQGAGALGGGHVSLSAGKSITNIDAVAPTNGRVTKGTAANPLAANQSLIELGGGDVTVRSGGNIDAGVYYVERGRGTLEAGGQITTNSTRSPGLINTLTGVNTSGDSNTWLPTTLFLGKASFDISARGDVLLGPVANAFLLPQGLGNSYWNKTYFSTYAADSSVTVASLGGQVTLRTGASVNNVFTPLLQAWGAAQQVLRSNSSANFQPWLRLAETDVTPFSAAVGLMAPTLRVTSFSGDVSIAGNLTLAPAANGTIEVLAKGSLNGLRPVGLTSPSPGSTFTAWAAATINLSDTDPSSIPSVSAPFAYQNLVGTTEATSTRADFLESIDKLFRESGGTLGDQAILETKQARHAAGLLHRGDTTPARLYAGGGDISGLTFFSPKQSRIIASRDISDVSFYLQHVSGIKDISIVAAGRDLLPYNPNSISRVAANRTGNIAISSYKTLSASALAGDLQIAGQGAFQVLAGRHLDLGAGSNLPDGTGAGITSIGNARNPYLAFEGADIIAGAGIGIATSLTNSSLGFSKFIADFVLGPKSAAYLKEVSTDPNAPITAAGFQALPVEEQHRLALEIFYLVLRDAGRDHNDPRSDGFGNYDAGKAAIAALFPGAAWSGDIRTQSRDIRTKNGGDIVLFAPGGGLALASNIVGSPLAPPGIITDAGGNINIFTHTSIDLGISRIFTLRGGNEIIWSSIGDIAAGSSSKTVQAAPPTRVIIDPQSADVATDLAGLATGGGIGVLASVKGIPPGSVDLIAPEGTIDAGDAGIRATGNLNIAAAQVLNAGNISVGGTTSGAPASSIAAPSLGTISAANSSSAAAGTAAGSKTLAHNKPAAAGEDDVPSIITVELIGFGGGDGENEEEERRRGNGAE
jgi:filamentous hemagglutinin family protein